MSLLERNNLGSDKDITVVSFDFLHRTPCTSIFTPALTRLAMMERLHCIRDRDEIAVLFLPFFRVIGYHSLRIPTPIVKQCGETFWST